MILKNPLQKVNRSESQVVPLQVPNKSQDLSPDRVREKLGAVQTDQ
jgi:hypothetical protein